MTAPTRTAFFQLFSKTKTSRLQTMSRCYSRGLKRKPLKVLSSADVKSLGKSKTNVQSSDPKRIEFPSATTPSGRQKEPFHIVKTQRPSSHIKFEKLLEGDTRFGPVMLATKSRKQRERSGIIMLEGRRLIADALESGNHLEKLYFSSRQSLDELCEAVELSKNAEVYKINPSHLKLWSDVTTPPGVIGIFKRPRQGEINLSREGVLPITLICDNIRDPGNMGTLLRCAAAVGCQRVLTTKGCVDIWEPKVLRAGTGAQFRLPIINSLGWELIGNYLPENCHVILADSQGQQEQIRPAIAKKLAALEVSEDNENILSSINPETGVEEVVDGDYLDEGKLKIYDQVPLNRFEYSEIDYGSCSHVALIVGGETEGLSSAARKLAYDKYGQAAFIPMTSGVDSLNSALAGSIILFEMRRHMYLNATRPH